MKKIAARGALALGIMLALTVPLAQAASLTNCIDSIVTDNPAVNAGATTFCSGPKDGAFGIAPGTAELAILNLEFGPDMWQRLGVSGSVSDPFLMFSAGQPSGILTLGSFSASHFIIGLQALGEGGVAALSFYEFDYTGKSGKNTIRYDTLGIDRTSTVSPGLQAAALYVPMASAGGGDGGNGVVAEPGTWALAFAALAALGMTTRRRPGGC